MVIENIINSIGVAMVLLAYFLHTIKKIEQDNIFYHLLNLVGASLSCYGSYLINAIPFVVLEGVWAMVALIGLVKMRENR